MKNLSKTQKVFSLFLFIILIILFILVGKKDYSKEKEKINIISNNKEKADLSGFKSANSTTAYTAINSGNTIILFGFENNEFLESYSKIISEVAKDNDIEEILFYDYYNDRESKNATYESIKNYLINYLRKNDEGIFEIQSPSLLIIKDYEILYFDDSTIYLNYNLTPEIYWSEYNINSKKAELSMVFSLYKENN